MKLKFFAIGLSILLLNSCYVNSLRCVEHGLVNESVRISEQDTCYRQSGKNYVKGQRVQSRNVRDTAYASMREVIVGPGKWYERVIPGSEGEVVYREVVENDYTVRYTEGSNWQVLSQEPTVKRKLRFPVSEFDTTECCHLSWRALYAFPAALVCGVVELPFNLVSVLKSTAFGG